MERAQVIANMLRDMGLPESHLVRDERAASRRAILLSEKPFDGPCRRALLKLRPELEVEARAELDDALREG